MQTNVVMSVQNLQGKKQTKTISYVNPAATNEKLLELVRSLNALTTNILVTATKETKGEVL